MTAGTGSGLVLIVSSPKVRDCNFPRNGDNDLTLGLFTAPSCKLNCAFGVYPVLVDVDKPLLRFPDTCIDSLE